MFTIPFFAAALLLGPSAPQSQTPNQAEECGTALDPAQVAQIQAQQAAGLYEMPSIQGLAQSLGTGSPYIVPLTMHVVRTSAGTGGLPVDRLLDSIDDANVAFAAANIEFCMAGPVDYIDSDAFYFNINTTSEINALRTTNTVPGTINLYFTQNLANSSGGLCGISAFTTSSVQAIAFANNCVATSTNHSTFPHELGHYFDLFHTHETAFGEECVNGSNCAFAGDLVCDTPADPRLSSATVNSNCAYVGGETDSCTGAVYQPDATNLMSYSTKPCRTNFTPQQIARAEATLVNLRPELIWPICAAGYAVLCNPAVPNSTGFPALLGVSGSGSIAANDLVLSCQNLPNGQFAYFLNGTTNGVPVIPPGSQGHLCLSGVLGRYNLPSQIQFSGVTGEVALPLDLSQTPQAGVPVALQAGETRHFQLWYRDFNGGSTSIFSNSVAITFQ
ncbi:MAG: M43 family zinc metalloprotease [Planctomycetota bacterium]